MRILSRGFDRRLLWLSTGLAFLQAARPGLADIWRGQAEIEFHATSTLHDFSGTARTEPFDCVMVLDGPEVTLGGTAIVAVAGLDTRHAKRDQNMRRMFAADRFPVIAGVMDPTRVDAADLPPVPLRLTIRDRTQTVPAVLSDWQLEENRLRFVLSVPLSLRASGLSPPVFLGFIRVGDAVRVRVRVELNKSSIAASDP